MIEGFPRTPKVCKDSGAGYMSLDSLLHELRELEEALHRPETRCDRRQIEALLHPDFLEFGRSGQTYTKADILRMLPVEQAEIGGWAGDFNLKIASEGVALLTYKTAQLVQDGEHERHTLRASLWKRMSTGWQMLFHQGTPTGPFDIRGT